MQPVCFGPDAWARVYIWVKVRSVSVALVGTLRHPLSLPLCQKQTRTFWQGDSFRQVDLCGGECGSCHLPEEELAVASRLLLSVWLSVLRHFFVPTFKVAAAGVFFFNFPVIILWNTDVWFTTMSFNKQLLLSLSSKWEFPLVHLHWQPLKIFQSYT